MFLGAGEVIQVQLYSVVGDLDHLFPQQGSIRSSSWGGEWPRGSGSWLGQSIEAKNLLMAPSSRVKERTCSLAPQKGQSIGSISKTLRIHVNPRNAAALDRAVEIFFLALVGIVLLRALRVFRGIAAALASCGIRIETPVAQVLLAWIRYVLCNSGNEVEHVPASLAAVGASGLSRVSCVDDLLALFIPLQPVENEGTPDHVPAEPSGLVAGLGSYGSVNRETRLAKPCSKIPQSKNLKTDFCMTPRKKPKADSKRSS
jgi:hypothetical protein